MFSKSLVIGIIVNPLEVVGDDFRDSRTNTFEVGKMKRIVLFECSN